MPCLNRVTRKETAGPRCELTLLPAAAFDSRTDGETANAVGCEGSRARKREGDS